MLAIYFNPHHPRGWRLKETGDLQKVQKISIHTTLAGGDYRTAIHFPAMRDFNPHHPRGWRLHANCRTIAASRNFNPHHPRGWRPSRVKPLRRRREFQSTPPSRVATCLGGIVLDALKFQSTPPSRVATSAGKLGKLIQPFQSTPPSRVATAETGS